MENALLRTIIAEGSGLLRFLISIRKPSPKPEPLQSESPEEAFYRLYSPKQLNVEEPNVEGAKGLNVEGPGQLNVEAPERLNVEDLKVKAAQKAMAAVEEELNVTTPRTERKRDVSTVCLICGHHHIVTTSAALGEALRFARKEGVGSLEVQRRLEIAAEECDIAERIDFSPAQLEKSLPAEREFLKGFIPKLRDFRHQNDTITTVDDLEKAATVAQKLATEYKAKERELR